MSVKAPTMVAAFHLLAVKVSVGKWHATMRTGVMQRKRTPLLVSSNGQRRLEQHGFLQLIAAHLLAGQGTIPEAIEHQGIWRFELGKGDICHVLWMRATKAAYYSEQRT